MLLPPPTIASSKLASENETWRGMACVLTLPWYADEDRVVVGHVGDSRLYLIWNGAIRKLTADHSPVGEREDRGGADGEQKPCLISAVTKCSATLGPAFLREPDEEDLWK